MTGLGTNPSMLDKSAISNKLSHEKPQHNYASCSLSSLRGCNVGTLNCANLNVPYNVDNAVCALLPACSIPDPARFWGPPLFFLILIFGVEFVGF